MYMERDEITKEQLDVIAGYMSDELRERIHSELAPCAPVEFLEAYIATKEDPEMLDLLRSEFRDVYLALGYV